MLQVLSCFRTFAHAVPLLWTLFVIFVNWLTLTHLSSPSWDVIHSRKPFLTPKHMMCRSMRPLLPQSQPLLHGIVIACLHVYLIPSDREFLMGRFILWFPLYLACLAVCLPLWIAQQTGQSLAPMDLKRGSAECTLPAPAQCWPQSPSKSLYQIGQVTRHNAKALGVIYIACVSPGRMQRM